MITVVKLINKNIEIKHSLNNTPLAFRFNGKWLPVSQVLDIWKDTGIWWDGESEKTFYRVNTPEGSLFELYRDSVSRSWFLYRVYD